MKVPYAVPVSFCSAVGVMETLRDDAGITPPSVRKPDSVMVEAGAVTVTDGKEMVASARY